MSCTAEAEDEDEDGEEEHGAAEGEAEKLEDADTEVEVEERKKSGSAAEHVQPGAGQDEAVQYVLHHLFGNDSVDSALRVVLRMHRSLQPTFDAVVAGGRLADRLDAHDDADVLRAARCVFVLRELGYIVDHQHQHAGRGRLSAAASGRSTGGVRGPAALGSKLLPRLFPHSINLHPEAHCLSPR